MGLHNLDSQNLTELIREAEGVVEASQRHQWIDDLLDTYSNITQAPFGTQVEILKHCLKGFRSLILSKGTRGYMRKSGKLLKVIEANSANPYSVYLEYVDQPTFAATVTNYTVWKGTLFDTPADGETLVCWHPDKEYKPVSYDQIKRTGYSALGKRKRRKKLQEGR